MEKNTQLHTLQLFDTKVVAIIFENMHLPQVQTLLLNNIAKTRSIKSLENITEKIENFLFSKINQNLQKNSNFREKILKKFRLRILIDLYRLQDQSVSYLTDDIAAKLICELKIDHQTLNKAYLHPWRAKELDTVKNLKFETVLIECLKPILKGLSKPIKYLDKKGPESLYHKLNKLAEIYQTNLLVKTAQILITQHAEALIAAIPQLKNYFALVEASLEIADTSDVAISAKDHFEHLPAVIDKKTEEYPNNIAIEEWNSLANHYKSYTYGDLKQQSDALAAWLIAKNFPSDAIIGLFLEPSFDYVCCQLAVLKANLTFVPLDPYQDVGPERLKSIAATCEPVAILTHAALQEHAFAHYCKISEFDSKTYDLATLRKSEKFLSLSNKNLNNGELFHKKDKPKKEQRAYVIFTSGTTGNPKGIEISHAGIMPMVSGLAQAMKIDSKDCMAQYAQLTFDMSLAEIWVALCNGAKLKIIPLFKRLQYAELPTDFKGVTVAMLTPTVLRYFERKLDQPEFKTLRYVISAGEKGDFELFKSCEKKRGETNGKPNLLIRNGYGPAECTVATTMCQLEDEHSGTIHIGDALAGYTLYLLELKDSEQPYLTIESNHFKHFGEAQPDKLYELAIGGVGVGIGYFKNEELTQKRFLTLKHPLTGEPIKIFRTYDAVKLVRTAVNQQLLTVEKRLDRAIKPYGKIIYPEDIEAVLKKADEKNIEKVLVDVKLSENKHPEIAAYIKLQTGAQPINYVELFEYVKQHLSLTHAPRGWKIVKEFGTSVSSKGKVNPQQLDYIRGLDYHNLKVDVEIEQLKVSLQKLWQKVLEVPFDKFNLNDNFFYLGGTSMRCEELIQCVEEKFKLKLTASEIYRNPTFGQMLRAIRRHQKQIQVELIPLHIEKKSKENSLFLIHTLTGDAGSDYTLTDGKSNETFISQLIHSMRDQHIACDLYGISALSLSSLHHPLDMPTTIEEIATLYRMAIQKQQPQGPYYLLGWSAGGYIAYEIARQLRADKELATVFMLDTSHPCYRQSMNLAKFAEHLKMTAESFFLKLLGLGNTNNLNEQQLNLTVNSRLEKHQQIEELFGMLYQLVRKDQVKQRKLVTWSIIFHAIIEYQIKEILPFVHLYIAEKMIEERKLINLGWQQDFYQIIKITGANHTSIIRDEKDRNRIIENLVQHLVDIKSYFYLKPIIDDARKEYQSRRLNLKKIMMPVTLAAIKVSNNISKAQYFDHELFDLYKSDPKSELKVKNILITGDKGSGKTYLKHAILDRWASQSDNSKFVLTISVSLHEFKNKKLKKISEGDKTIEVIKQTLKKKIDLHDKIFDASEFKTCLSFLAPHILIIIEDYEKILNSKSYTDIKRWANQLVNESEYNILLLADTYNAPLKNFNKNKKALHLEVAAWDQIKIHEFIQVNYSDDKLSQFKTLCELHSEVLVLCRSPYFLKLLLKNLTSSSAESNNFSFNLIKVLQIFEKYQWRKYLKNPLNTKNMHEWDLDTFRAEYNKEFKFLTNFAFELFEEEKAEYEHFELIKSSKSLEDSTYSSSAESDEKIKELLKDVLQTSFINQKGDKEKIYVFKSELIRDYFYALYWVKPPHKNFSKVIWDSNRWNPKFSRIWSLVAGILAIEAERGSKIKLEQFFNQLVSKNEKYKPIGFYQYSVWMNCYSAAKDQIFGDLEQIIISKIISLMQWYLERLNRNMHYETADYSFTSTLKANSYLLHEPNIERFLIGFLKNNNGRIPSFLWVLELLQLHAKLNSEIETLLLNILTKPVQYPFLQSAFRLYNEQEKINKFKYNSYLNSDEKLTNNILLKQVFQPLLSLLKKSEKGEGFRYVSEVAGLNETDENFLTNIKTLLSWLVIDCPTEANSNTDRFLSDNEIVEWGKACVEIARTVLQSTATNEANLVFSYYQASFVFDPVIEKLGALNKESYENCFNELKIKEIKKLPIDQEVYRKFLFDILMSAYEKIPSEFTPFNKAKILVLECVIETKRSDIETLLQAMCKIYMGNSDKKNKHTNRNDRLDFYHELLKDNLGIAFLDTNELNKFIKDKLLKHRNSSEDIKVLKFAQYLSMLSTIDFKNHLATLKLSVNLTAQEVKTLFKSTTCSLKALYDYWDEKKYDIKALIPLCVSWIKQRNIMLWISNEGIIIAEPESTTSYTLLEFTDKNNEFYNLLQKGCENYLLHRQALFNLNAGPDKKLLKEEEKIIKQERKLFDEKNDTLLEMWAQILKRSSQQLKDHKREDKEKKKSKKIYSQSSSNLFYSTAHQRKEDDDEGQNNNQNSFAATVVRKI